MLRECRLATALSVSLFHDDRDRSLLAVLSLSSSLGLERPNDETGIAGIARAQMNHISIMRCVLA